MKILISNHWLKKWGGSETFTYTMVGEAVRQGHEVDLFTLVPGVVSDKIKDDFKVKISILNHPYDLILANHHTTVSALRSLGIDTKMIQTTHGIVKGKENPHSIADVNVAISEETKERILSEIEYDAPIIRNGIDCNRFKPTTEINEKPKTVLSMCFTDEANDVISKACKELGLEFIYFNKHKNPTFHIEKEMNKADIVIGLGRCVYEAMACGRNVIVFDKRPYQPSYADGYLDKETLQESIKNNCSGRRFKKQFTYKDLISEIEKYNSKGGEFNRQFALEELNIEKQFKKYLEL